MAKTFEQRVNQTQDKIHGLREQITAASAAGDQHAFHQAKAELSRQQIFLADMRRANVENIRAARTAVREARIARAQIVNTAANNNTQASSGAIGGASSVVAQLGANLSFFNQLQVQNLAALDAQTNMASTLDMINRMAEEDQRRAAKRSNKMGLFQIGATIFAGYLAGPAGAAAAAKATSTV